MRISSERRVGSQQSCNERSEPDESVATIFAGAPGKRSDIGSPESVLFPRNNQKSRIILPAYDIIRRYTVTGNGQGAVKNEKSPAYPFRGDKRGMVILLGNCPGNSGNYLLYFPRFFFRVSTSRQTMATADTAITITQIMMVSPVEKDFRSPCPRPTCGPGQKPLP